MAVRREKKIDTSSYTVDAKTEIYTNANELVNDCKNRTVRHGSYKLTDEKIRSRSNWYGVPDYNAALELLNTGYQPVVSKLNEELKVTSKLGPRFAFSNEVQGFMPVIPLALNGLPRCMLDVRIKPIKTKVLDIYYDMTATSEKDVDDFIKAGKMLLGTILALESQGYKFNLYALQSYWDCRNYAKHAIDLLCVKVKSSDRPLDLKRISFPLTHPAFFRVIGFDWESKSPVTRYLGDGRGRSIRDDFSKEDCEKIAKSMFGENVFYLSCTELINRNYDKESLKEVLTNAKIA